MSGSKHFSIKEGTDGLPWLQDLRLNVAILEYLNLHLRTCASNPYYRLIWCRIWVWKVKKNKAHPKRSVRIVKNTLIFEYSFADEHCSPTSMQCTMDMEEQLEKIDYLWMVVKQSSFISWNFFWFYVVVCFNVAHI